MLAFMLGQGSVQPNNSAAAKCQMIDECLKGRIEQGGYELGPNASDSESKGAFSYE